MIALQIRHTRIARLLKTRIHRDHFSRSCFLILIALMAITGCGRPSGDGPIQLQLNWIPDAQHGGFYAADVAGHFADHGLNVAIAQGGPNSSPVIQKLTMGRCDFAVANADQVLLARQQGADLVAVFAAMQSSPRCIMVQQDAGIDSLEQLGKVGSLALGDGKPFAEYLKSKVPLDGVRIVSYAGSVAKFLTAEDFAQQAYVFSEPLVVKARGGKPTTLMVSDLGFNPYSSVLITRRETWDKNPNLVRKVVAAVRSGWQAFLDDAQLTNERIMEENPEMDAKILEASVDIIRGLCKPTGFDQPLGSMSIERWQTLHDQLTELSLLNESAPSAESAFVTVPPLP